MGETALDEDLVDYRSCRVMQQIGESEQRCFDAKLQKLAGTVARHPTKLMQRFTANAKAEANARANIKVVTI